MVYRNNRFIIRSYCKKNREYVLEVEVYIQKYKTIAGIKKISSLEILNN